MRHFNFLHNLLYEYGLGMACLRHNYTKIIFFPGVKDGSGLKFLVTESLRPYDAGIMELGLIYTDHMAIPPGQFMFPLHGFCLPACTAVVRGHS